jgi:hypothetical protein
MTYVYEYVVGNDNVKVEYCFSSLSNAIKVVEMWVNGKFHRTNWMSPEGNKRLMTRLENHYVKLQLENSLSTEMDLDRDMPSYAL